MGDPDGFREIVICNDEHGRAAHGASGKANKVQGQKRVDAFLLKRSNRPLDQMSEPELYA